MLECIEERASLCSEIDSAGSGDSINILPSLFDKPSKTPIILSSKVLPGRQYSVIAVIAAPAIMAPNKTAKLGSIEGDNIVSVMQAPIIAPNVVASSVKFSEDRDLGICLVSLSNGCVMHTLINVS